MYVYVCTYVRMYIMYTYTYLVKIIYVAIYLIVTRLFLAYSYIFNIQKFFCFPTVSNSTLAITEVLSTTATVMTHTITSPVKTTMTPVTSTVSGMD